MINSRFVHFQATFRQLTKFVEGEIFNDEVLIMRDAQLVRICFAITFIMLPRICRLLLSLNLNLKFLAIYRYISRQYFYY